MSAALKHTPLREAHRRSGARLVEFGGWEMPVQYRGINEEYHTVRQAVGLFDVSHMGRLSLCGPDALPFLQHLLPRDLAKLGIGQIGYTVMCNAEGAAIDDLLVYCLGTEEFLLVVNASRLEADLDWMSPLLGGYPALRLEDQSRETGMIALQGPGAERVLGALGAAAAAELAYLECRRLTLSGESALVSRSGYTGEDGFELICPAAALEKIWGACLESGALPCGLGARDVLRTEMGYCLYGHELSLERSPLEAGLSWALSLGKEPAFIGKEALQRLQAQGGYDRLVGLTLSEQGIPRPGVAVLKSDGTRVGVVSSGTYSPGLQRGIALAFVAPEYRPAGTKLLVDLRGKGRQALVSRLPLVPAHIRRKGKG